MKSVDGLQTQKGAGLFNLKIDKTNSQDPVANMFQMMQMFQAMQGALAPQE